MTRDASMQLTRYLEAAPERVWHALTDADAHTEWYWPASMSPVVTSEPVAGGRFGIDAGEMGFSGTYLELDPPHRLLQSWRWRGDDTESRVAIQLTPTTTGTDLVVVHDQVDQPTADAYRAGWESCLARLPGWLEGNDPT